MVAVVVVITGDQKHVQKVFNLLFVVWLLKRKAIPNNIFGKDKS